MSVCETVYQEVLQLQGQIRTKQKALERCLDTCTDNCDKCKLIEQEINKLTEQLGNTEKKQATCALLPSLLGSWTLNANGFVLSVIINIGDIVDIGGLFLQGFVAPSGGADSIVGNYNTTQPQQMRFSRTFYVGTLDNPLSITQQYTGFQFANPTGTAPLTFAGTFIHSDEHGNSSGPFGWFMIKQ